MALPTSSFDTKLFVSTLTTVGLFALLNQVPPIYMDETKKKIIYWVGSTIGLAAQTYQHSLVSKLPIAQKYPPIRYAVHPLTALITGCLSLMLRSSWVEWPTAFGTTIAVTAQAIYCPGLFSIANAIGTGFLTLNNMGLYPILDYTSWHKIRDLRSQVFRNTSPKRPLFNKPNAVCRPWERRQEEFDSYHMLLERSDKTDKQIKEHQEQWKLDEEKAKESQRALEERTQQREEEIEKLQTQVFLELSCRWAPAHMKNCPPVDPSKYTHLPDLSRITHPDLLARCPRHAKVILAKNFNEDSFSDKAGRKYIERLGRQLIEKEILHPDRYNKEISPSHNPEEKKLAEKAYRTVQESLETLRSFLKIRTHCFQIPEYEHKIPWY